MSAGLMRLQPGVSLEEINRVSNVYRKTDNGDRRYCFIPAEELYWEPSLNNSYEMLNQGNRQHILLLSAVCLLVLLTGVINFANLYLVQMLKRSREFGIKKVFGVQGWTLFGQLWTENFLLVGVSLFIAWFFIEITVLPVTYLLGTTFGYTWFDLWLSLLFWLALPVVTSLYPLIKYHYLSPIKGIRAIGGTRSSVTTRLVFLFVQTAITFLLIILGLYFGKHLRFMLNTDPGFRTERILVAELMKEQQAFRRLTTEELEQSRARRTEVEKRLNECPMVERWIVDRNAMGEGGSLNKVMGTNDEVISMPVFFCANDFLDFYEVEVVEGAFPNDPKDWNHQLVLNESAMRAFGYSRMDEAFMRAEQPLWISITNGQIERGGLKPMPAVAIVKDFYFGHITEGKRPMAFILGGRADGRYQMVCTPGREADLENYLREMVQSIHGISDFEYFWMTEKVAGLYERDRQLAGIYITFALIAVFISCLGLLGISLFDIRQRYREIAIRKVNGAKRKDLYRLLSRKYALVLMAAFSVAVPVSYYLIYIYTADFVVKVPVGIGIYLIALVLVVAISLGTLAWQINRALLAFGPITKTSAGSVSMLIKAAVTDNIESFSWGLTRYFEDIKAKGREGTIIVRVADTCPLNLESTVSYGGEEGELGELIEYWVSENAVAGAYTGSKTSRYGMKLDQVRIPLFGKVAFGRTKALSMEDFVRTGLVKLLGEYGISVSTHAVGIGKVYLTLGAK